MTTPNLELPEFGEAGLPDGRELSRGMRRLDAVVQLAVLSFATEPPISPLLGQRVIVEAPATGEFAGRELHVAFYSQDGWVFFVPRDGWQAIVDANQFWVFDEDVPAWVAVDASFFAPGSALGDLLVFDGSAYQALTVGTDGYLLVADSTQPLGVRWASVSGGGGGGGGTVGPDAHPAVPNAADDEFEFGSSVDTTGARRTGATAWAWTNQSGASSAVAAGNLVLTGSTASSGTNNNIVEQAVSGSTYKYRCKSAIGRGVGNTGVFISIRNNSNGRLLILGYAIVSNAISLYVQRLSDPTTFVSNQALVAVNHGYVAGGALYGYLEIENDGTNLFFRHSFTGVPGTFNDIWTETVASYVGTPTHVGVGVNSVSTLVAALGVFDWFRKVA